MATKYKFEAEHNGHEITVEAVFGFAGGNVTAFDEFGNILATRCIYNDELDPIERIQLVFEVGMLAGYAMR